MILQTICATLSLIILMLFMGVYKLASVESVLAVGDTSKSFSIFGGLFLVSSLVLYTPQRDC